MKATEDEPCAYLYIKDCTWTVVGVSADEELPDKPMSVEEANQKFEKGELQDRKPKVATKIGKLEGPTTSSPIVFSKSKEEIKYKIRVIKKIVANKFCFEKNNL